LPLIWSACEIKLSTETPGDGRLSVSMHRVDQECPQTQRDSEGEAALTTLGQDLPRPLQTLQVYGHLKSPPDPGVVSKQPGGGSQEGAFNIPISGIRREGSQRGHGR